MKIRRFAGYITLLIIGLLVSYPAMSQVPVELSKEKVVISGVQYYIHQVKKGQTTFSIAKAYGVTVQEITAENPPALYGLREGQVLRIPAKAPVPAAVSQSAVTRDETKFSYHVLKRGETIYSLSRLYGISETDIVRSNTGMDITKLSVGTEIAIPRKDFMPPKQKMVQQDSRYIYHKVEKGESLTSIAEKYSVPLRVLRRENRNMRFPKVGDFVKVPANIADLPEPVEEPVEDTDTVVMEEPVIRLERPVGYTAVSKLNGSIDVAVLLPFYLDRNSNRYEGSPASKTRKRLPEEWIFPQSLDFVEMYNGILLAADTLRALGLNVNLQTWDIADDTAALYGLIRSGRLRDMDLIIGPVYSRNLQMLAPYAAEFEIPVVSPVPVLNSRVLEGNPTVFLANSSLEAAQRVLAREISMYNRNNMVFIHTDTSGRDPDVMRYKEFIFSELNQRMSYEDIRFREMVFYSRSKFGNDSINRISHTLSESMPNLVIIASEDPPVISEIMTGIHGLSKRYDVKVIAYPALAYIDNLDPRIFFDLNQLVFSPYRIDYTSEDAIQFNLDYFRKFLTMPLETSFAWIGYDIAYYFLSGIAMQGKGLMEHPELHHPSLLQNEFDFMRKSVNDGFENHKLFKIRYTRDYEIFQED